MDRLLDVGLPGLIFIALCVWLIRKVARAARTESDLEGQRLSGALADELQAARARAAASGRPALSVVPQDGPPLPPRAVPPMEGADVSGADPGHLPLVEALAAEREQQARAQQLPLGPTDVPRRIEVLWVRSNVTHVAWCERRRPATQAAAGMTRDVICVAQIERGAVKERWFFG